jgi:hypothetical protein
MLGGMSRQVRKVLKQLVGASGYHRVKHVDEENGTLPSLTLAAVPMTGLRRGDGRAIGTEGHTDANAYASLVCTCTCQQMTGKVRKALSKSARRCGSK